MSGITTREKLIGAAVGILAVATVAGGVALSPPTVDHGDVVPDAVVQEVVAQPVDIVAQAVKPQPVKPQPVFYEREPPTGARTICYVAEAPDPEKVGEVISTNQPGHRWGQFEAGKVEIKGYRMALATIPAGAFPDPRDISCGAVGYDPEKGELTARQTRCPPMPTMEVEQ